MPSLGEDHYIVAVARVVLGRCLAELGEVAESRDLLGRAHSVLVDTLGPEHTYTLQAAEGIASATE